MTVIIIGSTSIAATLAGVMAGACDDQVILVDAVTEGSVMDDEALFPRDPHGPRMAPPVEYALRHMEPVPEVRMELMERRRDYPCTARELRRQERGRRGRR